MKIKLNKTIYLEDVKDSVAQQFPQYQVSLEKNPMMGFQYVLIKKSGAIGAFVRLNGDTLVVDAAIPSAGVRFILILSGFIFFLIFFMKAKSEIANPVFHYLNNSFMLGNSPTATSQTNTNQFASENYQQAAVKADFPQYLTILPIVGIVLFTYFIFSQMRFLEYYGPNQFFIISFVINIVCIISQILLILKKKMGFYLYAGGLGIKLIHAYALGGVYIFYGMGWFFLLIEIALLVVYAVNLKYYR
jgi:hypothetical protein